MECLTLLTYLTEIQHYIESYYHFQKRPYSYATYKEGLCVIGQKEKGGHLISFECLVYISVMRKLHDKSIPVASSLSLCAREVKRSNSIRV